MKLSLMNFVLGISLVAANAFAAPGVWWGNWGQNSQHQSFAGVAGQTGSPLFVNIVYDPFGDQEDERAYAPGAPFVHYQTPLVDGNDVLREFKTGQFSNIKNWQVQT